MFDEIRKKHLSEILDLIIAFNNKIEQWIILQSEADTFFSTILKNIYKIFELNSDEYRIYDRRKIENFWETIRKVERGKHYIDKDLRLEKLIERLSEFLWKETPDNEKHFKKCDEYQAKRFFSKLFRSAKTEILIVDNYIDWKIFDYIDEIDNEVKIKILTKNGWHKGFINCYQSYKWWNVETRNICDNHDRYIIIDKEKIFLIWTSLNWIWKNDFTVKELNNKDKITDLYNSRNNTN